ncbi:hypothetical protein [Actinoallomurus oryzae]|uniref:hypothetical protein n=1 Tax=Actinoallomurus oryzae TaxID=502180 RepID=UPI0031ECC00E
MSGESGAVYQVEGVPFGPPGGRSRLHLCHDQTGRERVAKLYPAPVADPQAAEWIRAAAARGAAVLADTEPAGTPDTSINFPIDVLVGGQAVVGVILPFIPRPFLYDNGRPRTFDHLCAAPADPPPAAFRVEALIRVCEILAVLEGAGLVHGDISPENLLWRPDRPHAYLIGCDGLRPVGSAATRGAGTQGFADPRWITGRIGAHDEYGDRYGLAVLMYRGLLLAPDAPALVGDAWHRPTGLPGDLDPRLRALFDRAFGDPYATDARPTAAQWRDTLRGVFPGEDGTGHREEAVQALDRHAQRFRDAAAAAPPGAPGGPWPGMAPVPPGPPLPPGPPVAPMPPGPLGPPGPPYGPPMRPAAPSGARTVAIVLTPIVAVAVLVLGVVALQSHHGGAKSALSTPYPFPDPATTAPYPDPTVPVPDPTTSDPYPDPITTPPEPDPTTPYEPPAPPPEHWGAIAVAHDGSLGKSWDYGSESGAKKRAMRECPRTGWARQARRL